MADQTSSRPHPFDGAFQQNLEAIIDILDMGPAAGCGRRIGFELERILIDAAGKTVPYGGERGVRALLEELSRSRNDGELVYTDGHLLGLAFSVDVDGEPVGVTISLEPAAQLEISCGPARSVSALYEALCCVDAQIEEALRTCGIDAALVPVGYNPAVSHPTELELIPKERYRDMDAYLSRHGRFARDMMRCTASTQVSLDYTGEQDAMRLYRASTILGPLFAFLFDNAPRFRGEAAPGMARSRIWHHVDVDRCGIVPGALDGLTFENYALWVAGVKPILFTDAEHVTTSTGERYAREIMAERPLSHDELLHLLSMVFPNVRLKGFVELREMDALPPRLAAACTSFVGALLYDEGLEAKLAKRLATWLPYGFDEIDEHDAVLARLALEDFGWDALVYGAPVDAFAKALLAIARENVARASVCGQARETCDDRAARDFDREGIELLAELWERKQLPRDATAQELPETPSGSEG